MDLAAWKVGQEHIVKITGLTHEGQGVGRVEERVVFVPESIPGDRVKVRLAHLKERLGYGERLETLEESSDRREPSCLNAKLCGGCQLQHMDYAAQLRWKRQQVQDAMERIGRLQVEVLPVLGMENPYHYRNNVQLPLGKQNGKTVMGLFQKGSHDIVDLETCEIQHPLITRLALAVKKAVQKFAIAPYDEINHTGMLRHVVIRVSFSEEKLMLILVTRTPNLPASDKLIAQLVTDVPELVSVAHNVNSSVTNVTLGRETKVVWGEPYLMDSIGHLRYAISPGSFFQVNPRQTKVLYDLVRRRMPLTGTETILDLYCGTGTIGLYLASEAREVIGVESFAAAVQDAHFNAELNSISNAKFYAGRAEEELPRLMKRYKRIDGVVLDPPRKGCAPSLLDSLVQAQIPAICYVSCNPSTLARDLNYLVNRGYALGEIQPVDMFPWTRHVECVVLMPRVGE
ncbi:MAG: 23S rRNA (uracil(1939)-C(5))-methyltransferase RlmD [Limnochordia bacterium]|nr:23S rRNA (uracil(1939)-C(5))-methyltransferase RlmD [Limnochordia bacterium]